VRNALRSSAQKILLGLGLALPLAIGSLARAELKIGYVDLQRALLEVDDARQAKTRLQSIVDDRKKKFEQEQNVLMKEKDAFEKQMSAMSADARSQRQTDLGKKAYELGQRWEKEKADLSQKEQSEMQAIFAKMNPIIASIAQREGMTFVFEKNEAGILYAPAYLDITNELVRVYNDQKTSKAKGEIKPSRTVDTKPRPQKKK
jgi:outer membrane protein